MSFPLTQRLTFQGAVADENIPDPAVADDATGQGGWAIIESDLSGPESLQHVSGYMGENTPRFTTSVREAVALQPESSDDAGEQTPSEPSVPAAP